MTQQSLFRESLKYFVIVFLTPTGAQGLSISVCTCQNCQKALRGPSEHSESNQRALRKHSESTRKAIKVLKIRVIQSEPKSTLSYFITCELTLHICSAQPFSEAISGLGVGHLQEGRWCMCEWLRLVMVCVQGPGSNLALQPVTRLRPERTVTILMNSLVLDKYLQLLSNLHVKICSVSKVWKCFCFFKENKKYWIWNSSLKDPLFRGNIKFALVWLLNGFKSSLSQSSLIEVEGWD